MGDCAKCETLRRVAAELLDTAPDREAVELADWLDAQQWRRAGSRERAARIVTLLRAYQPAVVAGRLIQVAAHD